MAITVKIEQETKKEISFLCLMKDVKSELVVLFVAEETGFVVSPNMHWKVGECSDGWKDATDKKEWEPSPPVTLSNS